jgi:O-antigen ligase
MALTGEDTRQLDLEPSHLRDHTYATRRRHRLIDVSALIGLMIVTLYLLPSALVAPQLSTVGRPALLLGLLLTAVWAFTKLHPQLAMRGPQPIRWAVAVWFVALLLSYAAGQSRGLDPLEASSTDLSMLFNLVFCGIILACADGVPSRRRLFDLLRIMVWSGGLMAVIALIQALLDLDLTQYLQLPGFEFHHELIGFEQRAGFERIASTTGHYIELSAVMAITLPFAIHVARFAEPRLVRQLATIAGLLIAITIPLTLSRTGILAAMVMAVTMLPAWSWRIRFNLAAISIGLIAVAIVARPGFMGTVRSLFTDWSGDNSIQGRTSRYEIVFEFFEQRPWLGRGPGTFVPDLYLILDNQWLGVLVSSGVIGVIGLAGLHLTAIWLAWKTYRTSPRPADRHLAACLLTAQVIAVVGAGTFDSFAFTTFATTVAICTGLTGALWRLAHRSAEVRSTGARLSDPWYPRVPPRQPGGESAPAPPASPAVP